MAHRTFQRTSRHGSTPILVAIVAMLVVVSSMTFPPVAAVSAQSAPRISYPPPDAIVPGPDVPVSIEGGAGSNGGAVQVTLDGDLQTDAEMIGGTFLLRDVASGDHRVEIQPAGSSGPATGAGSVVDFTVLPALTASIAMGICAGFNATAVAEIGTLSVEGSAQQVDGGTTYPVGVPGAVQVVTTDEVIDLSLDALLDRAHSITISVAGTAGDDSELALCGEVGGSVTDGALRFGLSSRDDAEAFGVATLTEDGDRTRVQVDVVQSSEAPITLASDGVLPEGVAASAAINQGICAGFSDTITFDLESIASRSPLSATAQDDIQGVVLAATVISSTIELSTQLTELLARAHAINIQASGINGADAESIITCGTIGGPAFEGTLRVGLLPADDSGVAGIATLTASDVGVVVNLDLIRGQSPDPDLATGVITPPTPVAATDPTGDLSEEIPVVEDPPEEPVPPVEPEIPVDPGVPSEPAPPVEPLPPTEAPIPATEVPAAPTAVPEVPTEAPIPPTVVPTEAPVATEPPPVTESPVVTEPTVVTETPVEAPSTATVDPGAPTLSNDEVVVDVSPTAGA